MARGKFITLEGGEGAGKSTHAPLLAEALREEGITTLVTREPGGAPGAEEIRELLVNGDIARWDAQTETLLHFSARRDHLVRMVWPALDRGQWVISDRFVDSTIAYQCFGHGLSLEFAEALRKLVIGDFVPDLTILLDLPVAIGLGRASKRKDEQNRYEKMGVDFHEKIRQGFKKIVKGNPKRYFIVDARKDIDEVHDKILCIVKDNLLK